MARFLIKIAKFRPLEIILPDVLGSWHFVTWDNFRCTLRIWCPFYSMINRKAFLNLMTSCRLRELGGYIPTLCIYIYCLGIEYDFKYSPTELDTCIEYFILFIAAECWFFRISSGPTQDYWQLQWRKDYRYFRVSVWANRSPKRQWKMKGSPSSWKKSSARYFSCFEN